jgi:hypothetical protein
LEPQPDIAAAPSPALQESKGPTVVWLEPGEKSQSPEDVHIKKERPAPGWLDDAGIEIIRATRSWIQYGTLGFAVVCIVIGAVEALFGR